MYIFLAVATLIGTPTGGALLREVDEAHFLRLVLFTGLLLAAGTLVLCFAALADRMSPGGVAWGRRLRRRRDAEGDAEAMVPPS